MYQLLHSAARNTYVPDTAYGLAATIAARNAINRLRAIGREKRNNAAIKSFIQNKTYNAQQTYPFFDRSYLMTHEALIGLGPTRQRYAFMAYYIENRKVDDIAKEMDIEPNTVWALTNHAKKKIRARLNTESSFTRFSK